MKERKIVLKDDIKQGLCRLGKIWTLRAEFTGRSQKNGGRL